MSLSRKIRWVTLLGVLTAGTVFQAFVGVNGCGQYWAAEALTAFDMCSVLNCSGGTFFNLCSPVRLLVDCPAAPTGP